MSRRAVEFLVNVYEVPVEKIQIIEHGVPDVEASEITLLKNLSQFKNRRVLLTFGLISRNKGFGNRCKGIAQKLLKIIRRDVCGFG